LTTHDIDALLASQLPSQKLRNAGELVLSAEALLQEEASEKAYQTIAIYEFVGAGIVGENQLPGLNKF
jgi:hypothetical protein